MPPWNLITPANRGLSLALARHLLRSTTTPLVATTRGSPDSLADSILSPADPSSYLSPPDTPPGRTVSPETAHLLSQPGDASRLHCLRLDVLDEPSIAAAAAHCRALFPPSQPSHLHLALLAPGVLHPEKSPAALDAAALLDTFRTNLIGPLLLAKHFTPFLPRKATSLEDLPGLPRPAVWATLGARVGSIGDNRAGGWYGYRASKAGVAQVGKTLDHYLRATAGEKAVAVTLHPGTVRTGLSREFWGSVAEEKLFRPEFSAEKLLGVLRGMGGEGRGRVWDWKGEEVPP